MNPLTTATRRAGDGVDAVERALALLSAFDQRSPALRLADLAERTGLYKSTALRLLASLRRRGFIARGEDRRYRIGAEAWRVGALFMHELKLEERLPPIMRQLSERTEESVALWIPRADLDPPMRVCVLRVDAPRSVRDHLSVGDRVPLDRGSTGRVLCAFLDGRPRKRGDALGAHRVHASWGARDPEVCGVSAPVFGPDGGLVGALTLSAPTVRRDRAWMESMKPLVVSAAESATRALGLDPAAGARPGTRGEA